MRKPLVIGLLILLSAFCFAQETVNTDQITILWDAVTTLRNGDPILETDIITYQVYIGIGMIFPDTPIGETAELFIDYTLPDEGQYIIGVRTIRDVGGQLSYSTWNCIILIYEDAPEMPQGLRIE